MSIQAIPSSIWMAPPLSMQTHSRPDTTRRVPNSHSGGQAIAFSTQSCQGSPLAIRLRHCPSTKLEQFGQPKGGQKCETLTRPESPVAAGPAAEDPATTKVKGILEEPRPPKHRRRRRSALRSLQTHSAQERRGTEAGDR